MNYISDILYWISTGLLVPVIVLLIVLFVRALVLAGSFFGQYLVVRKTDTVIRKALDGIHRSNLQELIKLLPESNSSMSLAYMRKVLSAGSDKALVNRLLNYFEIEADKDLAVSKTLAKLGPMLGLMGTLIPMGPALVGLSTGDIASMAYNMQVAFATTVVGLFSSAIGFMTLQVKQRWYVREMADLEYVASLYDDKKDDVL